MMLQQLALPQSGDLPNFDRKIDRYTYQQLLITPEHQQRVERIARKHIRGTLMSWEDAAQAAHEKVLQATQAGKFRQGGVREFYHWATTVARFEIIDHIRKHQRGNWQSLDQNIPGTNLPLSETIASDFNFLDTLERTDLVRQAVDAITELDRCYPKRGYLKLWQGKVQGKNQSQLAAELGITQGTISKRWKELSQCIAEKLGFLKVEQVQQELQTNRKQKRVRVRSDSRW